MKSFLQENTQRLIYAFCFICSLLLLASIDIGLILFGHSPSDETIWYLIRSSGIVAYLLLTASTAWGIMLSSKIVKEWIPAPIALELHNYISWTALGLSIYHAYLLLFSTYYSYGWLDILLPFSGPYEPFWVGLGILGAYLMLLTSLAFYVSKWISYATFRKIHYLTYAVFAMALLHGWMSGADSEAMGAVYLGSGLLVFFLTTYRVLAGQSTPTKPQVEAQPYTLIRR